MSCTKLTGKLPVCHVAFAQYFSLNLPSRLRHDNVRVRCLSETSRDCMQLADAVRLVTWLADALVAGVGEVVTGDGVTTTRRRLIAGAGRPQTARIDAFTSPADSTASITNTG